ncbi:MAG: TMEM43 family protein [Desulfobulbaceae bacterium]|nr:TMEM43 family protein [Desulfobulbaceae bacterium]
MSNDSFTEVTSQSWFGRLGNAFKGIIVGIIMVTIAFPLLFWNEGRAVKRYKTLQEGGGAVVSIAADKVDAINQGKLVHLIGKAVTEETLTDQVFGVSSQAIKLMRVAEMYQWQQESHSEEKKKLGGGTETTTTYTYNKIWTDNLINSGSFKKPEGHQNPAQMEYQSQEIVAGKVTVGAFTMSPSLVRKMKGYTPAALGSDYQLPDNFTDRAQVASNTIYLGNDPASPQVGDMRVSFQEVKPMDISLIASQLNETFEPYRAKAGGTIELLEPGVHSADAMFQQALKSNTILTWVLRGVGFIVMLFGLQLILTPLSVFADVLPILGSIVGMGTGLVAGLSAAILSSLTISVAWFVYRPVIGIIMLAIAGGGGFFLFTRLKKTPPVETAAK